MPSSAGVKQTARAAGRGRRGTQARNRSRPADTCRLPELPRRLFAACLARELGREPQQLRAPPMLRPGIGTPGKGVAPPPPASAPPQPRLPGTRGAREASGVAGRLTTLTRCFPTPRGLAAVRQGAVRERVEAEKNEGHRLGGQVIC